MILILVLVMVGFFMAGYWVHKKQYQELERSIELERNKYKDELSYYEESRVEISRIKRDLDKQADTLKLNYDHRWKEIEERIHENDRLKSQIFMIQKNCKCGGATLNGPAR